MGKFTNYAEKYGTNLEALLNQAALRTVEKGLRTLVGNTKMDSGRAAYHWNLIPGSKSGTRPAARRISHFDYNVRGTGPVGAKPGSYVSKEPIIKAVLAREISQVLRRSLSGGKQVTKGMGTTTYTFYNPTPDSRGEYDRDNQLPYAEYAKLEQAKADAIAVMRITLANHLAKQNSRTVRARFR